MAEENKEGVRKPVFTRNTGAQEDKQYDYSTQPLGVPSVSPIAQSGALCPGTVHPPGKPSVGPTTAKSTIPPTPQARSPIPPTPQAKPVAPPAAVVAPKPVSPPTPVLPPVPVQEIDTEFEPEEVLPIIQPVKSPDLVADENKIVAETKAELRQTAREIAREKYQPLDTQPIDTLEKALRDIKIKGVRWGVIGAGQGGGRLAEQFFKFGYPACVINTAKQDLTFIDVPAENKLVMDYSLGGAGKDLTIGDAAIVEYQEEVLELMRKTFTPNDVETIIVCIGGGGGTGSGCAPNLVKLVHSFGMPVVVLYTLPMSAEGALTKSNAIRALQKIATLSQSDMVNALVIVDNAKIEQIYPQITAGKFWKVANFDIVNALNMFNTLCRCDTNYDSLDPMDFARIMSAGNCTVYGHIEVPVTMKDGQMQMFESELANMVVANLQSGLLAEGFNLEETVAAGIVVTGRADILDQIPAVNLHFMYSELNRLLGDARVYHGLYRDESPKDCLNIYTIFSGLGLPYKRVDSLLRDAEAAETAIEKKTADKSKMSLTSETSAPGEGDQYDQMRQRNTAFGRLANKRGQRRRRG